VIDPEEQAAFEAWKIAKLRAAIDVSVTAYNTEMQALAIAWETGAKQTMAALHKFGIEITDAMQEAILAENPQRKPGMTGAIK
jgi:hypothetical protein